MPQVHEASRRFSIAKPSFIPRVYRGKATSCHLYPGLPRIRPQFNGLYFFFPATPKPISLALHISLSCYRLPPPGSPPGSCHRAISSCHCLPWTTQPVYCHLCMSLLPLEEEPLQDEVFNLVLHVALSGLFCYSAHTGEAHRMMRTGSPMGNHPARLRQSGDLQLCSCCKPLPQGMPSIPVSN